MKFRSVLEWDARLSDQMRVAEKPGALRAIAVFCAHSGDSWFWGAALVILWWRAKLSSNTFWEHWSVIQLMGISLLAVLVLMLKFSIRRRRPEGEWGSIYRNTDPHSFPSGHAARAILIAIIATGWGPAWLAIILWIWVPLVALARVAMGVHYVSDILGGIAVGAIIGWTWLQMSDIFLKFIWVNLPFVN